MIDPALLKEMDLWDAKFRLHPHTRQAGFPSAVESWVQLYVEGPPSYREAMRFVVADRNRDRLADAIDCYAIDARDRLSGPENHEYLRLGVGAVSMANCPSDYRDTLLGLAKLVVQAERVGIDPVPTLKEIALISSNEVPRGGSKPMRTVLEDFHTYAVVDEERKAK